MIKLKCSNSSITETYSACIPEGNSLRNKLEDNEPYFSEQEADYLEKAVSARLFEIPSLDGGGIKNYKVIGDITKEELINVYNYYMVNSKSLGGGRKIYDQVLLTSEKCPFCGEIGVSTTLDHILAKSKYPQFSFFLANLVPACKDCNHSKLASSASTMEEQTLHPYFDELCFFEEKWITAEIIEENNNIVAVFSVSSPSIWSNANKRRAESHFDKFSLKRRYSIEAATEISSIRYERKTTFKNTSSDEFKKYLINRANNEAYFINHWKRVLYGALANNDWFCTNAF